MLQNIELYLSLNVDSIEIEKILVCEDRPWKESPVED